MTVYVNGNPCEAQTGILYQSALSRWYAVLGYEYCYLIRCDVIHVPEQTVSCHTVTPNGRFIGQVGVSLPLWTQ